MSKSSPILAKPTLAARIERAAMMAYVHGAKDANIAKALGIKRVTLRDWRKRPEWEAAVTRLREEQAKLVSDRLALMTDKAATAINQSPYMMGVLSSIHLLGLTLIVGSSILVCLRSFGFLLPDLHPSDVMRPAICMAPRRRNRSSLP